LGKFRSGTPFPKIIFVIYEKIIILSEFRSENATKHCTTVGIPHFLYFPITAYEVTRINEQNYSVKKYDATIREHRNAHIVNVHEKSCTCGIWQDTELPCLEAMVYFRKVLGKPFADILLEDVSPFYTFWALQNLYDENVHPVAISTLEPDENTLAPVGVERRQPGRPKERRVRFRSKFTYPKKDCPIICSKCGRRGHNKKTCEIHKALEEAAKKRIAEKKSAERAASAAAAAAADQKPAANGGEESTATEDDITEEELCLAMELLMKDPGFMKNIM
jgi:hypothetical protein